MITNDQSGVICDICQSVQSGKFIYFSASLTKVEVDVALAKNGIANIKNGIVDFDMCEKCYNKICENIIKGQ